MLKMRSFLKRNVKFAKIWKLHSQTPVGLPRLGTLFPDTRDAITRTYITAIKFSNFAAHKR